MYNDGQEYFGTHWWWDNYDREYTICATWKFHKNYPDTPDEWELVTWEIEETNPPLSNEAWHYLPETIEQSIKEDGPPMKLDEVDYAN
tara:strand:+ start:54 stop:317 length:264 start_codon:yes stop_codon:yes gene_type:complete